MQWLYHCKFLQNIWHKFGHHEHINLQLRHVDYIFNINSVNFTSHNHFHNKRSHSDGLDNVIITQIHIASSDYLTRVECNPMQSPLFGSSRIHDPLAHAPKICSITHCKCVIIIVLCILYVFALFVFCFLGKTCNVALFVVIETWPCALAQKWVVHFHL